MGRNRQRRRRRRPVFVYTIRFPGSLRGPVLLFGIPGKITLHARHALRARGGTSGGGIFGHFLWLARDICVRSPLLAGHEQLTSRAPPKHPKHVWRRPMKLIYKLPKTLIILIRGNVVLVSICVYTQMCVRR